MSKGKPQQKVESKCVREMVGQARSSKENRVNGLRVSLTQVGLIGMLFQYQKQCSFVHHMQYMDGECFSLVEIANKWWNRPEESCRGRMDESSRLEMFENGNAPVPPIKNESSPGTQ